jgi:hypothetical protein
MKKKELKKELENVCKALDAISKENQELLSWHANNQVKINESETWRRKYEELLHTPEYKLNAEQAFNRGVYNARQKMGAWLMTTGQQMISEKEPVDEPTM